MYWDKIEDKLIASTQHSPWTGKEITAWEVENTHLDRGENWTHSLGMELSWKSISR